MRALSFFVSLVAFSSCGVVEEGPCDVPIRSGSEEARCPLQEPSTAQSWRDLEAIVDREAGTVVVEYERESDGATVREIWRIVGEG